MNGKDNGNRSAAFGVEALTRTTKLRMSVIRVLAVDDYAPLQRFILQLFEPERGLKIVAMASGGLEAVQIAKELRPT